MKYRSFIIHRFTLFSKTNVERAIVLTYAFQATLYWLFTPLLTLSALIQGLTINELVRSGSVRKGFHVTCILQCMLTQALHRHATFSLTGQWSLLKYFAWHLYTAYPRFKCVRMNGVLWKVSYTASIFSSLIILYCIHDFLWEFITHPYPDIDD